MAVALTNSESFGVLNEAIRLNKAKLWTNYISANALNPLSLVLQLARNVAGGGDVAQGKLTIAQLRAQRTAIEDATRGFIIQHLTDYETATRLEATTRDQLAAHQRRMQIVEVSLRAGDVSTEEFLLLMQQGEQLRAQIETAQANERAALVKLREIVTPSRLPVQPKKP